MITGAWKMLIEIIYNITGNLCLGVCIYTLLTLTEIISISTIVMYFVEKVRTKR